MPLKRRRAKSRSTSDITFYLGPSRIHGIGVFATHRIAPGTYLRLFSPTEVAVLRRPSVHTRDFIQQYGVAEGNGRFWTAPDFGRMSVGWYLNHSRRPNAYRYRYRYYSSRWIDAHHEITIDYRTLDPR